VRTDASQNTSAGSNALVSLTSGAGNSVFGSSAGESLTAALGSTAVGVDALTSDQTGSNATAVGRNALQSYTSGVGDTAVGAFALLNATAANDNSAFGVNALQGDDTGSGNTAVGTNALESNGSDNNSVAVGDDALQSASGGGGNTAIGKSAGAAVSTGVHNIAIGDGALGSATTGSNNIEIGNGGTASDANTIRVGTQGTQTQSFMAGISSATVTGAGTAAVNINTSTGELGIATSSRRFKTDIRPLGASLRAALMRLKPVSFRYKARYSGSARGPQYGLIAEEVAKVLPALVTRDASGRPFTVDYGQLPALLLSELQRQQREIVALRRQLTRVRRR
jgi:hypothetical protein